MEDPAAADGSGKRKFMERLYADFDEFIAALWTKGVRYGIDAKLVRESIARDKGERVVIAGSKAPVEGKDASVDEQTDLLHRDDAPRLLSNGRMDLNHYRNRFPQVNAGTRLFKKVPRLMGHSGWDVQGKELAPVVVKDFDIQTMAGPGTQVTKEAAGEFVVAVKDGFLDIDAKSGQISVIDKIINREGVSMRTTGNLSLAGDDYEEHGEVQEKRVVEGHNMTFLADVFGSIMSDGGCVTLKQSISGGTIHSPGGMIEIEGSGSRAFLEARGGEVVVARAESCVVVADRVRIGRAVSCDVVADVVTIEQAEGCVVAAKTVTIKSSAARRDDGTLVTLLLPDLARFDYQRKILEEGRANATAQAEKLNVALQLLAAQPDMKSYVAVQPKIKAKSIVLTAAQQTQWDALLARVAPLLRKVAALNAEIKDLREQVVGVDAELVALEQARKDASKDIACTIESVAGDTRVSSQRISTDEPPLATLSPKGLHKRLRDIGNSGNRLFSGASGSFAWQAPTEE